MEIVGRDREQRIIAEFLDPGRRGGGTLLLEGEAGIGKTTLWRNAQAGAVPYYRVLSSRARELEGAISFATVDDLVGDVLGEVGDRLATPQRRALERALLLADDHGSPPDPQAIAFAFLSTLRTLAADRPVLVAIDDVHWLDRPSASVVLYAARRLDDEGIRFLITRRTDATGDSAWLDRAVSEDGIRRVELGPLSIGALHHIVRAQLGVSVSRPVLHRIHRESAGNPFYGVELARAIAPADARPDLASPLPLPGSLSVLVADRLAALPRETEAGLRVVSLVARPTVELVTAVLGRPPMLLPAIDAGIINVKHGVISFTHPLLASGLAARVEPAEAGFLHRRIAALTTDLEDRARHLAQGAGEADLEVAEVLDAAARQAARRGAPEVAGELLDRALELTPAGHHSRFERLLAASDALRDAGDWPRARELAAEAAAGAPAGAPRARALLLVGQASSDALPAYVEARAEEIDDPALESRIYLALSEARLTTSFSLALDDTDAALAAAERAGDPTLIAHSLSTMAWFQGALNEGDPFATLARAESIELPAAPGPSVFSRRFNSATLHMWRDDHDTARSEFADELTETRDRGDVYGQAHALLHLAQVEWRAGRWREADVCATEALELWPVEEAQARGALLWIASVIAVHRGELETARRMVDEIVTTSDYDHLHAARSSWVQGLIRLAQRDTRSALADFERARDGFSGLGILEPGMRLFVPDLIEALVVERRLDDALELASEFEEQGRRLDRPRARAIGARGRALVLAARGDVESAIGTLTDALELHAVWSSPLEQARSLLALGTIERRARRRKAARETLGRALGVFVDLGAAPLAEQTRDELARTGGRATRASGLTASEERVAALVADGHSNREVAAELVVSVHTVEAALTSIYRKLDVRSRTELALKLITDRKQ